MLLLTSALLGVAILGCGALSLTCLAFLSFATALVGLVPAVFCKVALRQHTQIHRRGLDHAVLAMATVRISAAFKMYVSNEREFRSKCSRNKGISQMIKRDSQLDC